MYNLAGASVGQALDMVGQQLSVSDRVGSGWRYTRVGACQSRSKQS